MFITLLWFTRNTKIQREERQGRLILGLHAPSDNPGSQMDFFGLHSLIRSLWYSYFWCIWKTQIISYPENFQESGHPHHNGGRLGREAAPLMGALWRLLVGGLVGRPGWGASLTRGRRHLRAEHTQQTWARRPGAGMEAERLRGVGLPPWSLDLPVRPGLTARETGPVWLHQLQTVWPWAVWALVSSPIKWDDIRPSGLSMRTKRKKRYIISPMPGIYKVFLKSSCHHSEMCFLLMSETLSPLQSGLGANGSCRKATTFAPQDPSKWLNNRGPQKGSQTQHNYCSCALFVILTLRGLFDHNSWGLCAVFN